MTLRITFRTAILLYPSVALWICRKNLLEYCKLDTYAMVKVLEKLQEVAG